MSRLLFTFFIIFTWIDLILAKANNTELVLVHVVFRHGIRTPADTYPKDPYIKETFFPVGWGHLTNPGKLQMYQNGLFIRDRYNEFLNSYLTDKVLYARATDSDRAINSAQLVAAGIWPPNEEQKWGPINWQPVPVRSDALNEDNLLLVRKPCAQYHIELDKVMAEGEVKNKLEDNQKLFQDLSKITGLVIKDFDDVQSLYSTLRAESFFNLTLPQWTKQYYPDVLQPLTEFSYIVNAYNNKLKRLKGGVLLRKLLTDWHQVANTSNSNTQNSTLLDLLHSKEWIANANNYGEITNERKLFLFGGHDSTITNLLRALNVWDIQNPDYGITVLFELRKNIKTHDFEVQIYLRNRTDILPYLLTVPGCESSCPLLRLTDLVDPVIPRNLTEECYDPDYIPPEIGGP